ncbi:LuxR C-terminal-related transcriptional regulator [Shinella sp. PSBB067]
MAARLGLKPHTVAGYVKVIYQKLNISTRAEATREAIHRRLA